jgi:hypothetical protein
MAKCLAVALLLLVVLASCEGRELNQKDGALAATCGAGAGGGVDESKILGLPELPLTTTITGPVVVLPALPGIPAHPWSSPVYVLADHKLKLTGRVALDF